MKSTVKVAQTLDMESACVGAYVENKFYFENLENALSDVDFLWKSSPGLGEDKKYRFLSLYLKNNSLSDFAPDPARYLETEKSIHSHRAAAITAKLDLSALCFFDSLPDHILNRWFSIRESAMRKVASAIPPPPDYDILHKIHVLVDSISRNPLNVNGEKRKVKYDFLSSATGRLTTVKNSYPILSLSKSDRSSVTPWNDMFLELDLNGAEIRTLLGLSGTDQPAYDIHEFNRITAAKDLTKRSEVKARFFAWLYNPKARDRNLEKFYDKTIYRNHYKNGTITTPFGRELRVDDRKALNYLTQSTTSDIVLENAYKIMKILNKRKSFVSFTMHDSVVLDFCKEDHDLVQEIKNTFENNMFGNFLSSIRIGKNFGNLKELII